MKHKHGALLDQRPLLVMPALAKQYGLNEAIILQQLHWTLQSRPSLIEEKDGRRWVQAPLDYWMGEFPFWSEPTIRRTFAALKDGGLIQTERGREGNAYSINYERLIDRADDRTDQIERTERSDRPDESDQIDRSPIDAVETTTQTTSDQNNEGGETPLFDPGPPSGKSEPESAPKPTGGAADKVTDEMVAEVFNEFVAVFGDRMRVKTLTPARDRVIRKALKAVDCDVALCKRAVHGLLCWRQAGHPGDYSLSTIFETNMHSKSNLTDQIEWWSNQANQTLPDEQTRVPLDLAGVPPVTAGTIKQRRAEVARMATMPQDEDAQTRGKAAVDWLREHVGHVAVIEDGRVRYHHE